MGCTAHPATQTQPKGLFLQKLTSEAEQCRRKEQPGQLAVGPREWWVTEGVWNLNMVDSNPIDFGFFFWTFIINIIVAHVSVIYVSLDMCGPQSMCRGQSTTLGIWFSSCLAEAGYLLFLPCCIL